MRYYIGWSCRNTVGCFIFQFTSITFGASIPDFSNIHGSHSQLRIYYFLGHLQDKMTIFRTKYTIFKGNKSRYVRKAYNIYSMMIDFWHFYGTSLILTPSSCLTHPLLFKFELTWDIKTMYRYRFSFTIGSFLLEA